MKNYIIVFNGYRGKETVFRTSARTLKRAERFAEQLAMTRKDEDIYIYEAVKKVKYTHTCERELVTETMRDAQ